MEIDCGESNRGKRGHPTQRERDRERMRNISRAKKRMEETQTIQLET